ncbi:MAG: hypothetical protein IT426_09290 [Pirellulales bacterium]|nr:hypothetical protein [Pirellulales bacterium]
MSSWNKKWSLAILAAICGIVAVVGNTKASSVPPQPYCEGVETLSPDSIGRERGELRIHKSVFESAVAIGPGRPEADAPEPKYHVAASGIVISLDAQGGIAGCSLGEGKIAQPLEGGTSLSGCLTQGEVTVKSLPGGGYEFARKLVDGRQRVCVQTDRFTPAKDSVRWEVEIVGEGGDPRSVPIVTRLNCRNPRESLFWTAWSDPKQSAVLRPDPQPETLLTNGRVSYPDIPDRWVDPLECRPFTDVHWYYGNEDRAGPTGHNYISIPLATVVSRKRDAGVSLVLSPEDVLLNMSLTISQAGDIEFKRTRHRLGGERPLRFSMDFVGHEADWRGGLRWMVARYPRYFEPKIPLADEMAGCAAYSGNEQPLEAAKFRRMSFRVNWKLCDDYPYMGMFIPPVTDIDEKWERAGDEPTPPGKTRTTSCRQMNDYAKWMRNRGFYVLNYFNVCEFGRNMVDREIDPKIIDDPDLWKDPVAFIKLKLPHAYFQPPAFTCYNAWVVDPGDPAYRQFLLEQAERHIRLIPDASGICIDRLDWLRFYNANADDGVSWVNDKPARCGYESWKLLAAKLGPLLRKSNQVLFVNPHPMRQELLREVDGVYTEFGCDTGAFNAVALMCLKMPALAWTVNENFQKEDPHAFFQRHLYLGVYPTAPYPNNNHCITPHPDRDRHYLDYGPLLDALRGKKWVLAPHCVECASPEVKVNLFQVPGGFVAPVTFGGSARLAVLRIRGVAGLENVRCEAIYPAEDKFQSLASSFKDGVLEIPVPLKHGCAVVRIVPSGSPNGSSGRAVP